MVSREGRANRWLSALPTRPEFAERKITLNRCGSRVEGRTTGAVDPPLPCQQARVPVRKDPFPRLLVAGQAVDVSGCSGGAGGEEPVAGSGCGRAGAGLGRVCGFGAGRGVAVGRGVAAAAGLGVEEAVGLAVAVAVGRSVGEAVGLASAVDVGLAVWDAAGGCAVGDVAGGGGVLVGNASTWPEVAAVAVGVAVGGTVVAVAAGGLAPKETLGKPTVAVGGGEGVGVGLVPPPESGWVGMVVGLAVAGGVGLLDGVGLRVPTVDWLLVALAAWVTVTTSRSRFQPSGLPSPEA